MNVNNNILSYLERRRLGFNVTKNSVYNLYIQKLHYDHEVDDHLTTSYMKEAGIITAWKFSRNRPNLHMIGGCSLNGKIILQNTTQKYDCPYSINAFKYQTIQRCPIYNFAWAEPRLKLVTASDDLTSCLCSIDQSGKITVERRFHYNLKVQSVMFCPASSDLFCGSCQDGSIRIFDARLSSKHCVIDHEDNIPNAHGMHRPILVNFKNRRVLSTVIFKDDKTVISCYSMDQYIKVWDLRKMYQNTRANNVPTPVMKYYKQNYSYNFGYKDMVMNPQSTLLYGSGSNNVIYCYSLDSLNKEPICKYTGHCTRSDYSRISISHDGHFLFSGCLDYGGVIWRTDFPHIRDPIAKTLFNKHQNKRELSISDWCADPTNLKLATSAESLPIVWSIIDRNTRPCKIQFIRTKATPEKPKSKVNTAPVKNESVLETEDDMEEDMEDED